MDNAPSPNLNNQTTQSPEPEDLKPRTDDGAVAAEAPPPPQPPGAPQTGKKPHRRTYRPSHKATFIGLAAVVVILVINAIVIGVVLKKQTKDDDLAKRGQVTISSAELSKLGINRSTLGNAGTELIVGPDAQFKGKMSVVGETKISGELILNNKLTGTDASLAQLQAGNTSLSQLNVNGDGTLSNLNLRRDLVVAGATRLQGAVTLSQLLTVNNSINVIGNLSVGGVLAVNKFSVQSLAIGGHLISSGSAPTVSKGSAVGSNGTVAISGNDIAGTVSINIGVGATGGVLANVTFRTQYGNIPKVVITPVGVGGNFYLSSLGTGGFSIAVTSGLPPGGYKVNYIAVQ